MICWEPKDIHKVIHTDAETIPASVFMAVHTDYDLNLSGPAIDSDVVTPDKFLHDYFLSDIQENEIMTVVKGESGSGKSHFIQWLRLNIPDTEDTHLITIPKSKTNLQSVLEMLIDQLESTQQNQFKTKLHGAVASLKTKQQQINKLLDNIALAIQTAQPSQNDDGTMAFLIDQLPAVFRDPYFSTNFFNKDHEVITNLAEHIFGDTDVNQKAEVKQTFGKEHLPLNAKNITMAAKPTQDVLGALLSVEEMQQSALNLINDNLDKAISYTMSFSPDDLIKLMIEIRKLLHTQDKQLIFLIEDFALLQGVDMALLQALITRSTPDEPLCRLRWAMAVTTGYFSTIAETVKTRITYEINMDIPWGDNQQKQQDYILQLGTAYLNAIRQGPNKISQWFDHERNEKKYLDKKCVQCSEKSKCFEAFGEINGVGLYPFNRSAMTKMARHADKDKTDIFRPRLFLNRVILKNLNQDNVNKIKDGKYPHWALRDEYKIRLMQPEDAGELKRLDRINYERRQVLIELWGGTGEIINLPEGIHDAFKIPQLPGLPEVASVTPTLVDTKQEPTPVTPTPIDPKPKPTPVTPTPVDTKPEPTPVEPKPDDSRIAALKVWAQGEHLRELDAQYFRDLIYDAVINSMDWDFSKVGKSLNTFAKRNIYFLRQQTQKTVSSFILTIPLSEDEKDIPDVYEVLKTLHLLRDRKHFECDLDVLARTNDYIESLRNYVKENLETYYSASKGWDPFSASVELLILSTIASNKFDHTDSISMEKILVNFMDSDGSLTPLPSQPLSLKELFDNRTEYQKIVKATLTGRKGGNEKDSFLDVEKIMSYYEDFANKQWLLTQNPDDETRQEFTNLAKRYKSFQQQFNILMQDEIQQRKSWLSSVEDKFSIDSIDSAQLVETLDALRNKAKQLALSGWQSTKFDAIKNIDLREVKKYLQFSKTLTKNQEATFVDLYPIKISEMQRLIEFIDTYDTIVNEIENSLNRRKKELTIGTISPDLLLEDMSQAVNEISKLFIELTGDGNASK